MLTASHESQSVIIRQRNEGIFFFFCAVVCRQRPCGPRVQVLMSADVSDCRPPEEGLGVGGMRMRRKALIWLCDGAR